MDTVAIFGVGLIGGSFALALKSEGFKGTIIGVSSPATIAAASKVGAIDEALPAEEAARRADLIYLAQPISRILETLPGLNTWVRENTLVTDAGSTKSAIVARAAATLSRCQFLGGHPMAGKERRGVESADPDLFRGRRYVLTPSDGAELRSPAAAQFLDWLRRIGAEILITSPAVHDEVVAYTSHLPQLTATALAFCLASHFAGNVPPLWGPGLVDSTRLALSHFDIWGDILATNHSAIDSALAGYIQQLEDFRRQLLSGEMRYYFEGAAGLARTVRDEE